MNWYGNETTNTWDSHITKALTSAYDDALRAPKNSEFSARKPGMLHRILSRGISSKARNAGNTIRNSLPPALLNVFNEAEFVFPGYILRVPRNYHTPPGHSLPLSE